MRAAGRGVRLIRGERHRQPRVHIAREAETLRRDPDHRVRLAIKLQGTADHVLRAAQRALPETVTQNHHAVLADRILLREEHPSARRLDAVDVEVMRRRLNADEPLRFGLTGQIQTRAGVGGEMLE